MKLKLKDDDFYDQMLFVFVRLLINLEVRIPFRINICSSEAPGWEHLDNKALNSGLSSDLEKSLRKVVNLSSLITGCPPNADIQDFFFNLNLENTERIVDYFGFYDIL